MKKILLAALLPFLLISCIPREPGPGTDRYPLATIEMEDGGLIEIELYPDLAPDTVANFIELAKGGFYDGLIFHRIMPGHFIQGGCPYGTGRGGPGYAIKGEFEANGYENDLSHEAGVISMARQPEDYDSAGSQFFITAGDVRYLDGDYAAFGRVVKGLDVAERISFAEKDADDKPLLPQRIKSVTVETYGQEFPPPSKIGGKK